MVSSAPDDCVIAIAAGFPMLCSRGAVSYSERGAATRQRVLDLGRNRLLPWGVDPRGIAVNTATFAALYWAMELLVKSTVARRRMRRGACSSCGYAMGPLASCPECGAVRSSTIV